jgi:hypothetical protein
VLDLRYNCAGSTVWNVFGKNYGLACGMGGNALFGLWPIRLASIFFVERDRLTNGTLVRWNTEHLSSF